MRILLTILLLAISAAAQTHSELEAKYGAPTGNIYHVRPGVVVEVEFSKNGKATEFRIVSDDSSKKNALLSIDVVRAVIAELVPGRVAHRPIIVTEIKKPCPPRRGCLGFQEVWKTLTTLIVWHKDSVAYAVVKLSDKAFPPPGNMRLLPGYEHTPHYGIDTAVGTIKKDGGLEIRYDIGPLAGSAARRYADPSQTEWFRTEQVNGNFVVIVLRKDKTIVASFEKDFANFIGTVTSQSDIDDFLNLVRTYDPEFRDK